MNCSSVKEEASNSIGFNYCNSNSNLKKTTSFSNIKESLKKSNSFSQIGDKLTSGGLDINGLAGLTGFSSNSLGIIIYKPTPDGDTTRVIISLLELSWLCEKSLLCKPEEQLRSSIQKENSRSSISRTR